MYRTEVVCDNMIFLNNSGHQVTEITDADAPHERKNKKQNENIAIEDIPF